MTERLTTRCNPTLLASVSQTARWVFSRMLEQTALLVVRAVEPGAYLPIHAAVSGTQVGLVEWRRAAARLFGPSLQVAEWPEPAAVFCVDRRWRFGKWTVSDAEGRPLAILRGQRIHSASGGLLVYRDDANNLNLANGVDVGRLADIGAAVRVEFHPRAAGEPFLKMLLLTSAVLAALERT